MSRNISESLNKLKAAIAGANGGDDFGKAITVGLGLVNYDLEAAAKLMFPWGEKITPLRTEIERGTSGRGDTAHRWKQISAINSTQLPPGVSEGNRSGVVTTVEVDKLSPYAGLGLEDYVTEEARYAAEGFDDVLTLASENLLKAVMISEEKMIFAGNSSVALGTPTTPTLANGLTTGGTLSNVAYYVVVVALTHDGWLRATVASGVVQTISRTNADGTADTINGGTSQPSAVASFTLTGGGSTQTIYCTVPAIQGAVAYAWYIGTSAAHQYLSQITTINSAQITAVPANTFQDAQALVAADYSNVGTTYGFSGIAYQGPFASGSGAYYRALATGTPGTGSQLTADNAGGIQEFNTLLRDRYDTYRLSPDTIWLHSQEINSVKVLVVKNGGAPLVRFVGDINQPLINLQAGAVVGFYTNPVTMEPIRIRVHPFGMQGTALFTTRESPYAGSRVSSLLKILCRQEYYSTLWPMRSRKREYGVYVDETLLVYFPPAFAAIANIAPTLS
jgi:hypothetical protein